MATKVAINGFGRIGRLVARAILERTDHEKGSRHDQEQEREEQERDDAKPVPGDRVEESPARLRGRHGSGGDFSHQARKRRAPARSRGRP